jgi:hypothetical protein
LVAWAKHKAKVWILLLEYYSFTIKWSSHLLYMNI